MGFNFFVATCMLAFGFSSAFGHDEAIYSSKTIMDVSWESKVNETNVLDLDEINEFERAISMLLYKTMKDGSPSFLLPDQHILGVDMHVKNISTEVSLVQVTAIVDVLYVGETGVSDMASILFRISQQENVVLEDIYNILGNKAHSVMLNFKNLEPYAANTLWEFEEHSHDKEKSDKTLILACALLCAALVLVTAVLLYVAGGWRDLRERLEEQMEWFKEQRKTYSGEDSDEESGGVDVADSESYANDDDDSDDDATSPSGIIGATSKEEQGAAQGLGINRTPERGINDDGYDTTPFSEMSTYTDASRAPLGISSMRKMQRDGQRHDNLLSLPPLAYQ